jgi:uncharacterized protein (DUF342 family)
MMFPLSYGDCSLYLQQEFEMGASFPRMMCQAALIALILCCSSVFVGCGPTKQQRYDVLKEELVQTQRELAQAEAALLDLQDELAQYADETEWPESQASLYTDRAEVVMTLKELEANLKGRMAALRD